MPDPQRMVINTGPLIALVAGLGNLNLLRVLYREVVVPHEVCQEIFAGGPTGFAMSEFKEAIWLKKWPASIEINSFLANSLDRGEASVIQLALNEKIQTVCIDEPVGRRIARLSGLSLTGSIGILIRAQKEGHLPSLRPVIERMRKNGVWLSERVVSFALQQVGETT